MKPVKYVTVGGSGAIIPVRVPQSNRTRDLGESARVIRAFSGHEASPASLTWSPDGGRLACGAMDGTIRIWDAESGKGRVLRGHRRGVRALAWAGGRLASAGDDRTIRLWDDGGGGTDLHGHAGPVHALAWSPDAGMLVSGGDDGGVRTWDPTTGVCLRAMEGHREWVRAVAVSPDGRRIASASDDSSARLWDAATGSLLGVLSGHRNWVRGVAFSPATRRIATGSFDGSVRLWGADTGDTAATLHAEGMRASAVAFSADGRLLVAASEEGVRIWRIDTREVLADLPGGSLAFHPARSEAALIVEGDTEVLHIGLDVPGAAPGVSEWGRRPLREWAGAARTTLALAFTDIVGSTRLTGELGEEKMADLRRAHFAAVRRLIDEHRGREIKTIGDAFMVAFRTAVDALDFSLALQRATKDDPLRVRVGLHVGPVSIEEEDAFGPMVNYAARVQAQAQGPEVWLSDRAREDIAADRAARHRDLRWTEHPDRELKGFEGRHRVWSVES